MSQTVQVKLRIDVRLDAKDRIVHRLDLRQILDEARMVELLVDALESRGFEEQDDGTLRREQQDGERQGEVQTVDLDSLEIVAERAARRELSGDVEGLVEVEFDRRQQEDALRERVVQRERDALRRELAEELEGGEAARKQELNEVLEEVYARALKEKAGQLGRVVSEHESRSEDGEYELVIKVEV